MPKVSGREDTLSWVLRGDLSAAMVFCWVDKKSVDLFERLIGAWASNGGDSAGKFLVQEFDSVCATCCLSQQQVAKNKAPVPSHGAAASSNDNTPRDLSECAVR